MPRLTRKLIDALEAREGDYSVRDAEVIGLGVRVRPSGVKSFILTYRRGGQLRKLTLGRADESYSIDQARDHARAALTDLRNGIDPQAAKIADRNGLTINAMIDHYLANGPAMKPNKKKSSWNTNRMLFDCHVRPLLGRRLARDLILTGCRKSEILSLQWDFVDWDVGCLRLPVSKTGAKTVPLADAAVDLLKRRWDESRPPEQLRGHNSGPWPGGGSRSPFVLPALKGNGHFVGLPHLWTKVKERADEILRRKAVEAGKDPRDIRSLLNVRLHDLRHSFASFAIADGASLFLVGKVLGHKQARTTEIYAHLSDDPLKQVANRAASRLEEAMRF